MPHNPAAATVAIVTAPDAVPLIISSC